MEGFDTFGNSVDEFFVPIVSDDDILRKYTLS